MTVSDTIADAVSRVVPALKQWRLATGGTLAIGSLDLDADSLDAEDVARIECALTRTGLSASQASNQRVRLAVRLSESAGPVLPRLDGDESYRLSIHADGVELAAPEIWGALHGITTLAQLAHAGDVPCGAIEDGPDLAWRGVMLDPARHFLPLSLLEQTIDAMALFKLNVLHLHLSDDQGCRFRSQRYPSIALPDASYSSEQLSALVGFAAQRGVRIVAELDVPGHASALIAGYPQWGMTPTDKPSQPSNRFGVHRDCLNVARPQVRQAISELFDELAAIFGDECLHIGGDEVSTRAWADDAVVAEYLEQEGLRDVGGLQPHFNTILIEHIRKLGRRSIVWDEALHESLPRDSIVQAWRGVTALERALHAGHDAILSAPYYLDLFFPVDVHTRFRPDAPIDELLAQEDSLRTDSRLAHIAQGMAWTDQWRALPDAEPERARGRLLGAEACLWGELVDCEVLPTRLWSRMVGLADLFWRPRTEPATVWRKRQQVGIELLGDFAGDHFGLDAADVSNDFLTQPDARQFAAWLEPVKWYARLLGSDALNARLMGTEMPQARPYQADTPLNKMADHLPPESQVAWHLDEVVQRFLSGAVGAEEELAGIACTWSELSSTCEVPQDLQTLLALLGEAGEAVQRKLAGEPSLLAEIATRAQEPAGECVLSIAPALHRLSVEWPQ